MNKNIWAIVIGIVFLAACSPTAKETQNVDLDAEIAAVNETVKAYKTALENLNIDKTFDLFTEDAQIFETGGVEGSYQHYVDHHLGPELKVFKSFKFSDYKIETQVDLPYAFTTESYVYTIVLAKDERVIKQKGVATSVLKKNDGKWKIIRNHGSSRRIKNKEEGGH